MGGRLGERMILSVWDESAPFKTYCESVGCETLYVVGQSVGDIVAGHSYCDVCACPDAPWCERGGVADLEVDAVDGAGTNRGWFLTLSHS
jgi:hypothetical protein